MVCAVGMCMLILIWNDENGTKELLIELDSWQAALDYCVTYADHIKIITDYQGIHIIRMF